MREPIVQESVERGSYAPELNLAWPSVICKHGATDNRSQETEVGITLKQSKKSTVIRLEGAIDIAAAAEFKKLLLQACGTGKDVRVALDGATRSGCDRSAVDLGCKAIGGRGGCGFYDLRCGAGVRFIGSGPFRSSPVSVSFGSQLIKRDG